MQDDIRFMREALKSAKKAFDLDETPVGAVITLDGKIIARGYNLRETSQDPTQHAEMIAIRKAARKIGGWRLNECDMYVTLEPCPMCAGAIIQARLRNLIFGAADPKAGAAGSVVDLFTVEKFNHKVNVTSGILADECGGILKEFFRQRRKIKSK